KQLLVMALTLVTLRAQTISFEPARRFGIEATLGGPSCLASGDFNGDGRLDLLASNSFSDNLSLLFCKSDGTFQAPVCISVPAAGKSVQNGLPEVNPYRCLVAADLNKDGRLDVAMVSGDSDSIQILFGNGDGTFGRPLELRAGIRSYFIAAGDFDGDG